MKFVTETIAGYECKLILSDDERHIQRIMITVDTIGSEPLYLKRLFARDAVVAALSDDPRSTRLLKILKRTADRGHVENLP